MKLNWKKEKEKPLFFKNNKKIVKKERKGKGIFWRKCLGIFHVVDMNLQTCVEVAPMVVKT